jgi:hypothetical protein
MTTKERFLKMITDNGVFDDQAEKMMQSVIEEFNADSYKVTWDRPASEYPDAFYIVCFMRIKPIIVKWIDANIPQAWFRAMFV